MSYESIKEALIRESKEDDIGLWWIVGSVSGEVCTDSVLRGDELCMATLGMVRDLLEAGMVAGFPVRPDGKYSFKTWNISHDEIISKIKKEWQELGREPTVGEIVWLHLPS
ncbi:MAG: hypothetical protein JWM56_168 [Candidatus Peribacteria bacterium]|nr:hypothetical protein [Candidatus Peribacteria bacterium]